MSTPGRQWMSEVSPFKVTFSAGETNEFLRRARQILNDGWLVPGQNNTELEEGFADLVGTRSAVAVSSGTAALEILFRALDLSDSFVLIPANTNFATAEAAIRAGCRPVLYDAGLYPDLDLISRAHKAGVRALVVVHIGGYLAPDLFAIRQWCDHQGIFMIEDASHAHGSRLQGKYAGSFGHAAAFSTFATKVLTTAEGGIVTTNDSRLAELCRRYRDQGKGGDGLNHVVFGSAWRMSELHAALGVVRLLGLKSDLSHIKNLALRYVSGLEGSRLTVPYEPNVDYSGHKFIVVCRDGIAKHSLVRHLRVHQITPARGVYDVPLHRQPVLLLDSSQEFPVADAFCDSHVCLPMWRGLSMEQVDRVVEAIRAWYDSRVDDIS